MIIPQASCASLVFDWPADCLRKCWWVAGCWLEDGKPLEFPPHWRWSFGHQRPADAVEFPQWFQKDHCASGCAACSWSLALPDKDWWCQQASDRFDLPLLTRYSRLPSAIALFLWHPPQRSSSAESSDFCEWPRTSLPLSKLPFTGLANAEATLGC